MVYCGIGTGCPKTMNTRESLKKQSIYIHMQTGIESSGRGDFKYLTLIVLGD